VMVKLKLSIDMWSEKREKLLLDLADRVQWAYMRPESLVEHWKRLIKEARADLGYLFGYSTIPIVMDPMLLREWLKAMHEEDRFLSTLHDLPTPGLIEQLNKYQAGLALMIGELDQKWTALIERKADFRTPEQQAIAEAERIVMEVLDKQETAMREILKAAGDAHIVASKYVEAARKKVQAKLGEFGAAVAESQATKVIVKIITDDKISPAAKDGLSAASTGFNYLVALVGSTAREYLRRVDVYRYTLRYEGAILQMFKTHREQVAAYERDNNLQKAGDWRAQGIAAVLEWAKAAPTDFMKHDATLFATEVATAVQASYDRCKTLDENFRAKFNGLFSGPLSDQNLERLTERYLYEQQLGTLKLRGADRKLLAAPEQLKTTLDAELNKSLVPITTLAAEFPREAGEVLLLHGREFREILAQEADLKLRELIKANMELAQRLSAQGINQDFDRSEFASTLR